METFCAFMIFVCFFAKSSAYIISDSEVGSTTASTLVKEGLSAEIFCMVEGTGHYFWRKGESFHNSTHVASSTGDNGNKDNEPYAVKVNGTLFIRKVTLKDEGKYFCRVTSVKNECLGEVKVIVQASLRTFSIAIDRCDRESRCVLYLDPSQSISLTCMANNAPPSMTLKWFNGSKEITEGIIKNEIIRQNDNSRELTSRVSSVYGHPATLTCQAVDPKRSNDDVRFAHAQVEMTVPAHETLPSWIIVSVTLVGCFIVFGIFLLIKAKVNRKQRKKYTKLKREDVEALTKKVNTNEETIHAKHQELTEFKVSAESKDSELSELKDKLRKTDEELKKSRNDNIELQTNVAKYEANINSAEENLMSKAKSIAELEETVKQKDNEISNQREQILDCQMNLKSGKIALQGKNDDIDKLKSNLKEKKNEIVNLQKELAKLKGDVQSRPKKITDLETTLRKREEGIKEANIKIFKLQGALLEKERELNLARQPKGAQQCSQNKPRKKHQGNDGD